MKLLIIEDEAKTSAYLKKGLIENGYTVDVATDGEEGLHLAISHDYDLLILDVMLPKRDGWSVIEELRRQGKQTLSLMLTARDSVTDRVKGLDLGADAYMVKPFAFTELLALIRSLLRRGTSRQPELITVADLQIDMAHHRVTRQGKRLELTPKEFALLALLARKQGEVVSRTEICEQIWDINFDSDSNVVDVHIRRLRSKIDDPYEDKLIQTARGMGYYLSKEEA